MIVYKTTNLINGKFYVGKDASNNPNYYGSGLLLVKAIKKYGKENFKKEILEECKSLEDLNLREKYWITSLNATNKKIGYNIAIGGMGGDTYSNQSESRKKQIIATRNSSSYAYRQTEEYKQKRRNIAKQLWQRDDVRDKIKKKLSGREIIWKNKIGESNKKIWETRGDIRSEETKRIIAEQNSIKMRGYEFVKIPEEIQTKIINLYQKYGPKLIANEITKLGYSISPYIIRRFLKKSGIYKKWQKGIGDKKQKNVSISRRGKLNPMWKNKIMKNTIVNEEWFNEGAFETFKKPAIEKYELTTSSGVVETLEGKVNYNAGHYIMTGPKGEKYPISPEKFKSLKDDHGNGTCSPKKILKKAKLADHDGVLHTKWGDLAYTSNNDYIVRHSDGDYGAVKKDIFNITYDTSNS